MIYDLLEKMRYRHVLFVVELVTKLLAYNYKTNYAIEAVFAASTSLAPPLSLCQFARPQVLPSRRYAHNKGPY